MSVRDLRNAGWCWQEKAALDVLRDYYDGERLKRRATALAIYLVLTEIASDQYDPTTAETTHRVIWERTGTSETTVKQYLRELVTIGLLAVEHRQAAPLLSLPNVYHLLTPRGGAVDSPSGAVETLAPGATTGPSGAVDSHHPEERSFNNEPEEADSPHSIERMRRAVRGSLGRR